MLFSSIVLTTLSLFAAAVLSFPTHQFDQPLSTWHLLLRNIVHESCRTEFAIYQTGNGNVTLSRYDQTVNLIDCVLGNMSEYRKATMAASAVILGSAPMVLQTLGSTTAETAMLGLRRPFLATLLAAGSPAVATTKSSEFVDMLSKFVKGCATVDVTLPVFKWSRAHPTLQPMVTISQYLLAAAAVANVGTLAYQLGFHAIVAFTPDTTLMPPLWSFLAIVIHIGGTAVLHSRVRVRSREEYHEDRRGAVPSWVPDEFIPSAFQPPSRLEWRKEHVWFYGLTWLLSIATIIQILFGTLILSSLLFFTVRDAVLVVGRYAASSIVCRSIVRFELAGMKEATVFQENFQENTDQPQEDREEKLAVERATVRNL